MGVGGVYDDRQTFVVGTSTLNQGGGFVFLVESAFVDKGDFLVSTDGVTNRYPILPVLSIHMCRQRIPAFLVAQHLQRSLLHLLRRRQKSWAQHIKCENVNVKM